MATSKKPEPQVVTSPEARKIIVPEDLAMKDAAKYCAAAAEAEEEIAPVMRTFPALPWSGAAALEDVLRSDYSATEYDTSRIECETSSGPRRIVWGVWEVHGLGRVVCDTDMVGRAMRFQVSVFAKRKHHNRAQELLKRVGDAIATSAFYGGSALMLVPNDEGRLNLYDPPKAVEVERVEACELILPSALHRAVEAEVLAPITRSDEVAEAGLPCRRGILLAGRPGTGKTLTARIAASEAMERGWSVWYLTDSRGIEAALETARLYAPAVLIVEDLDRSMGGDRDGATDRILNALDGLDRSSQVVMIATTNAADKLPAPLIRPGRMDSVLVFEEPDEEAAAKLLLLNLPEEVEDLGTAPAICAGMLPAAIAEVGRRARLHTLGGSVDATSLEDAARAVRSQHALLERAEDGERPTVPVLRVISASEDAPLGSTPVQAVRVLS